MRDKWYNRSCCWNELIGKQIEQDNREIQRLTLIMVLCGSWLIAVITWFQQIVSDPKEIAGFILQTEHDYCVDKVEMAGRFVVLTWNPFSCKVRVKMYRSTISNCMHM